MNWNDFISDIAKCNGVECPIKDICFRHTSIKKNRPQFYYLEKYYKDNHCDKFIDSKKYEDNYER